MTFVAVAARSDAACQVVQRRPVRLLRAAVAFHEGTLVVGAYAQDSAAVGVDGDQQDDTLSSSGAVYVRKIAP
ncbi:MAG: hypothetical protein CVU56_16465 [Deltaproteobacteria bacterium HGW-Deltaproteobacteria-14]|nr:MAG: hypothetical protein CVU56_16465 [Deltaproteobacteria bacterium HGW-Deltaproteobacteria-14]